MKRVINLVVALVLCAAMLLTAAACGKDPTPPDADAQPSGSDNVPPADTDDPTEPNVTTTTTMPAQDGTKLTVNMEGEKYTIDAVLYTGDKYTILYPDEYIEVKKSEGYDVFQWKADGIYDYLSVIFAPNTADELAENFRKEMGDYFVNVDQDSVKVGGVDAIVYYCNNSNETVYEADTYVVSYFLPVDGGCIIIETKNSFETAETVGAYMFAMLESFRITK